MSNHWNTENVEKLVEFRLQSLTWAEISEAFLKKHKLDFSANCCRKAYYRYTRDNAQFAKVNVPVKVLLLDVETAPLEVYCWGLFDQNIGLNQVISHGAMLSWSAKWLGSDKVMYMDTRSEKDPKNDKKILQEIWKLIDEADVLLFQNGISFDRKVLNARFIQSGMKPPSSCRYIDTMRIAKKYFKFSSNKLEHLTGILCTEHRKSGHAEFPGFSLWKGCLDGNLRAWDEMRKYNEMDVLSMEELYYKLRPWDNALQFNVYHDENSFQCSCGSIDFKKYGFFYTNTSKHQRYICLNCGAESRDKENLLSKEKRQSLRK